MCLYLFFVFTWKIYAHNFKAREWVCGSYALLLFFYFIIWFILIAKVVTTLTHKNNRTRYGIFFLRSGDILHTHSLDSTRLTINSTSKKFYYRACYVPYISCSRTFRVLFVSIEYQNLLVVSPEHTLCSGDIARSLTIAPSPSNLHDIPFARHTYLSRHRFTLTCKTHSLSVCVCVRCSLASHTVFLAHSHTCMRYIETHIPEIQNMCSKTFWHLLAEHENGREWERNFVFIDFAPLIYVFVCVQYAMPV